jgi:protein-S-isoprenylcysteine O-methyltransferase Ste14
MVRVDGRLAVRLATYITAGLLMLIAAFVIFRVYVRRVYLERRRLTLVAALLETLIWGPFFSFPYIYSDSTWPYFLRDDPSVHPALWYVGNTGIIVGIVLCLAAMAWLGFGRSWGRKVNTLKTTGFYGFTRNPQIVLGFPSVLGVALRWPSWYSLGWMFLFGAMIHMMVLTEEEHLRDVFGEEYVTYCKEVPRYLGLRKKAPEFR